MKGLHCLLGAFLIAVLALISGGVFAHPVDLSRSQITLDGPIVEYDLLVSPKGLARVVGLTEGSGDFKAEEFTPFRDQISAYLDQRLRIEGDGKTCLSTGTEIDLSHLPVDVRLVRRFDCGGRPTELLVGYGLFFEIEPRHRSIGTIEFGPGNTQDILFDRTVPEAYFLTGTVSSISSEFTRIGHLILLGIEHILNGYDHILFVIALLLGAQNFWSMAKIITAFTLAHSLTLALAWFEVIIPPTTLVEVLIAISIAYVALENLMGWTGRHRWMLAGGFGLIHGMGFYSALKDIDLGGNILVTLFGFNLGIEIGQLCIIAVLFWPLYWIVRQPMGQTIVKSLSGLILIIALWWTLQRAGVI